MRYFALHLILWLLAEFELISARVQPRGDCEAKHVHLAVGRDSSTCMTVSFSSTSSGNGAPPVGYVALGTSSFALNLQVYEKVSSPVFYNLTEPSDRDYVYHSPYLHHVEVCGLEPDTTYYYEARTRPYGKHLRVDMSNPEVGYEEYQLQEDGSRRLNEPPYTPKDKRCPDKHKIRSFRTAPPAGSFPVTMALLADLGQFSHSVSTFERMVKDRKKIDAIIVAGDVGYANGHHGAWDTFFDFLDDYGVADEVPMQVCPGNHDVDRSELHNNTVEIFQAYEHRFRMPAVKPAVRGTYEGEITWANYHYPLPYDYGNAFYSWDYGGVHNIMLNCYTSMEPGSPQYEWLIDDLKSVQRQVTPWVVVSIHVPIYTTFENHHKDTQVLVIREHLEPIFVDHRVNLVVSGHVHAYQRTHPVAHGEPTSTGPVYLTVGSSGRACKAKYRDDSYDWIATSSNSSYGYGALVVVNATHAAYGWVHTGHSSDDFDIGSPDGPSSDRLMLENQYFL